MKPSTILAGALSTLALASPATLHRAAPSDPPGFVDTILKNRGISRVPMELIDDLNECLDAHKTFIPDYSKADDGVFSISNVDRTCCEKAKGIWSQLDGGYGEAVFTEPCEGATATGISQDYMGVLRAFFGET